MRPYGFRIRKHVRLISCLLSYALLATLPAPAMLRAGASSVKSGAAGKAARASAPKRAGADSPRKEGELLVRFRPEVSERGRDDIASSKGARRKGRQRGESAIEKLALQPGQDAAAVAEQLSTQPGVEFAEPNFVVTRAQLLPNDTRFVEQWALRNTGQSGGVSGSDVGASRAWQTTTGAASTVVAVIDSGVDFTHQDLSGNRWENSREKDNDKDDDRNDYTNDLYGWDFVTDTGVIRDEHGHGTAVAGIIAAQGNNRAGTSGMMWQASLMSLRVLDANGNGDVASAVEAIDYAVAQGAQVINCSWGTDAESLALRGAIERAGQHGVVVVASAGNSARDLDTTPYYPASFDLQNLISVASSDKFDNLAQFSNWGATRVTMAAPGVDILTTQLGGGYWLVSGTSASAPLVSGILGLVKTQQPWITAADAKQSVVDGARRVDTLAGKVFAGGVASASGSLSNLRGPYDPPHGGGNGNGNGNGGNGNGNGNGNNGGTPRVADPGRGRGNYNGTPPPPTSSAPAGGPDLNALRDQPASVPQAPPPAIHADLAPVCQNCYNDGGTDPQFASARSKPANETGQPNVDLGSRNFNWGTPLVSLPGRAGLDLNLGLYYNSLVWTKQQTSTNVWKVQFNPDNGFPGPGFHLGFPTIQKRFVDQDDEIDAYTLVTPSGGRVKMLVTGVTPEGYRVFTSRDGTYTQMIEYPTSLGSGALVRKTDGTQYTFFAIPSGEKRCSQIKDRNGNFITISYDGSNRVSSVTDTLGRVVNFIYDIDGNLYQLTQSRGGSGHTDLLVQFGYGTQFMQPSFTGVAGVLGPVNQNIAVLTTVQFPDSSFYQFYYTQWGQVWKVERHAPNGNLLTTESYNVPGSAYTGATAQTDCPRFTERHMWVRYGVMQQDGESVTTYSENSVAVCNQSPAADGSVPCKQTTAPDGAVYKEFYATSGWRKGFVTATEIWSGEVKKKWTTTTWTHDADEAYPTAINPRVTETNVYDDSGNRRRTTIDYGSYAQYSLPYVIQEFDSDGVTVLRRTITDYNLDATYVNRRIIGLPFQRLVYDGNWALMSKAQFWYDWSGSDMFQDTPAAATQHDRTNYGPSFVVGRGNLSDAVRFDVNDPNNSNGTAQETKSRYNAAGSLLMVRDPLWHATYLSYGDSFSDGNNSRNTFAYPTAVTDPEGYQSTAKYDYTTGAATETKRPSSGATAQGNVTYETHSIVYDWIARPQKDTNLNNGFYTRWEYPNPDDGLSIKVFQNIRPDLSENYSVQVFDGAGRVRRTATYMPGSTTTYSGSQVFYDSTGNLVQWSNPTEIDANWNPAGADSTTATPAGFGWVYSSRTYDWKGRPLLTTNPDATTTQVSYGGCGCAGGEIVTTRDERGRQKKLYHDSLGRMTKVEELNYDSTVYSTGVYAYNARYQITSIRQYQGAATSGVYQERIFHYDGHGRLDSRTTPEQGTCTYSYNPDDTLSLMTDARGATQGYQYTARHLPSLITYGGPSSVAPTPNVSFTYDAAGNRTLMTEAGFGSVSYSYDSLSRMTQESRTFTGVGTFALTYTFNNAGLASITGPQQFGSSQVSYSVDHTGAATSVTGAGAWSASVYSQNMQYRASGGVKAESYGNGRSLSVTYDKRLRLDSWLVSGVSGWKYSYGDFGENTGRVTYAQNLYDSVANAADQTLDRSYDYDNVGRLLNSYTGTEAKAHTGRPGGAWGVHDGPYSQAYIKDAWGNVTQKMGRAGDPDQFTATYTNNRRNGFTYDAAGNLTFDGGQTFTYDATGQQAQASYGGYLLQNLYDGDRLRVKKVENGAVTYYLRSSVLGGQVVAEISSSGGWARGYVYGAGGGLLAIQAAGVVTWVYQDPATKSQRVTSASGAVTAAVDLDPWGLETARSWNSSQQPRRYTTYERDGNQSDEAAQRRYNRWHLRFDQPDPYDGSYDISDPQSFNRYAYTENDPVNFTDPSGLVPKIQYSTVDAGLGWYYFSDGFWGYLDPTFHIRHYGDDQYDRMFKDPREFGYSIDVWWYAWGGLLGPLNNPSSIRTSNKDCSISVSFTGEAEKGSPNGPGPAKFGPVTVQGLGFTTSVTVNQGGIGRVGDDINLLNPGGAWTVNQAAWSTYTYNGKPDRVTRPVDIGTDSVVNLYNGIGGRSSQVDYYDHPGFVDKGVKSFSGNYTFIIRATNGEKSCSVSFRMELSFSEGSGWSVKWGR